MSLTRVSLPRLFAATALLASFTLVSAAQATNFSFSGNFAHNNSVQPFSFTVGTTSNVTLKTLSYAGGTNSAGTVIARGGFDPILALFDSTGTFIDQNDDGGSNVPGDTGFGGAHYDTFLQSTLAPGTYTVTIMEYNNFAIGPNLSNGFQHSADANPDFLGGFPDSNGRDSHWAFDVLNVNSAVVQPEPATLSVSAGTALVALRRRRA